MTVLTGYIARIGVGTAESDTQRHIYGSIKQYINDNT